ncbi:winged helix-turn-helix transcriptional regulator [Microbacterium arborescens]|uniref:winged helix-turn-helix transcriptional regulator n=1 Tax=Microbacterium arborescens TaxID=33883 RepID=UPI00278097D7|nr:helix-turn-helix domain-containing protein [Microbacterium arborescens]MDQ1217372.1 DNA-binding HxlR family transcriptional regulator [Microbacterium arborescens]
MTDTAPAATDRFEITAPHRELLDQVLDRWSLAVLNELCDAPARFSTLRRAIPVVTQKSLTATLRRLERNGIIERVVLSTRPVAVEYRITPLGKTLRPPVDVILAWAQEHMPRIEDARRRFDDAMDETPRAGEGS